MPPLTLIDRRGVLLVFSSPSGAGKSTLTNMLLKNDGRFRMSVSATTRAPRGNEVDGKDYHFVTPQKFDEMMANKEFIEWAEVHNNRYGTIKSQVNDLLKRGTDVVFDLDWQGAAQLKETSAYDAVTIFILPPSLAELERRLRSRATDSLDVIERRLAKARDEIKHCQEFDYVLVNGTIESCFKEIQEIIAAERRRTIRQIGLKRFVDMNLRTADSEDGSNPTTPLASQQNTDAPANGQLLTTPQQKFSGALLTTPAAPLGGVFTTPKRE